MTLALILTATLVSGLLSMVAAAWLSFGVLARLVRHLVSLSVGLLLATAVLHLLPEGFGSGADAHALAWTLLAGLIGFIALERLSILRHSHHHEGDGHAHDHGHDEREAGPGGMLVLVGDTVHNFGDGILIAAAFLISPEVGWLTALAVAAHEIPQEVGDFLVLLNAGYTKRRAYVYNAVASLSAVLGGLIGYLFLEAATGVLPFVLMIAAASFIYIALADLIPVMHRNVRVGDALQQFAFIGLGVGVIAAVTSLLHGHG
ncbi:MAG: ZIP family metal transporter [Burkholderiales bacterium]|nr:MAG: ZIP family metal transporter [Burkholderiales bacterium]